MGLETCRQLAAQGFTVVLTSRNSKAGKKLAETLRGEGLDIIHHRLDVTQPQSARQLAGFIEHTYGRVDVLVNNAGACLEPISDVNKPGARSLLDVSDEILQQTVLTNAMGPLYVARALAGMMRQRQSGRIINITSRMGALSEMGTGIPAYRFSKGVLNLITCMLAAELREQGIKVNAVDPGWVKTSMGGFERAPKSVEEGVDTTIWLATMKDGDEVPSGRCFRDRQPAEW
ncbi:MAG: SDR family NAD(P)-dependent oxidoreductase [Deltaproteobacteria bacterium]|nr:SDR family NAD(P)-dependent oxidoreductase [Deltaproteobacteria bacterium]